METYEVLTLVVATASLVTSVATFKVAQAANRSSKEIAKRQGVIDLHVQWNGINDINLSNPVVPDVKNAVNALSLTASLWNHDVVHKPIIMQSYWDIYRTLYDKLYIHNDVITGLGRTGKSMISPDIMKAYREMESYELSRVETSKL